MPRQHAREPDSPPSSARLVALMSGAPGPLSRDPDVRDLDRAPAGEGPGEGADEGLDDASAVAPAAAKERGFDRAGKRSHQKDDRPYTDPFRVAAPGPLDHGAGQLVPATRSGRRTPTSAERTRPSMLQLPEAIADARMRPKGLALIGMLIVVLAAAGLFGGRVWWAQRSAVPEAVAKVAGVESAGGRAPSRSQTPGSNRSARPSSTGGPGTASTAAGSISGIPPGPGSTSAQSSAPVIAHVVGAVRKPGVVRLPGPARVEDAIRRSGGLSSAADGASINLARPLVDGEQIVVLVRGAKAPAAGAAPGGAGPAPGPSPGGSQGTPSAANPIDLNAADLAALDQLPGVGPVMAQRIVAWRTEHGRFSTVDELGEVSGVGEKTLERLRPLVRV